MVVALAGCSGGGGGGSETQRDEPGRSAERPSTTAAPARIDLSQPIPGGSLHGTPRPPLENTGDDYVAIFESLIANFRWLTENPDPAVISELYVPGTEDHQQWVAAFQELSTKQWRAADEDYQLLSAEAVDVRPGFVSVRVSDYLGLERIIDAKDEQVGDGRTRQPPERTATVLLAMDESGRWRIVDWATAQEAVVEV